MIIKTKFDPKQRVLIIPLENLPGRVAEFSYDDRGIQYKVVYYTECKENAAWFFEDELTPVTK